MLAVWVADKSAVWVRGQLHGATVTLADGSSVKASLDQGGQHGGPGGFHFLQNGALLEADSPGVADMADLEHLHEPAVLQNLQLRHAAGPSGVDYRCLPHVWHTIVLSNCCTRFGLAKHRPRLQLVRRHLRRREPIHVRPRVGGQRRRPAAAQHLVGRLTIIVSSHLTISSHPIISGSRSATRAGAFTFLSSLGHPPSAIFYRAPCGTAMRFSRSGESF